jgi:hypothetical protein
MRVQHGNCLPYIFKRIYFEPPRQKGPEVNFAAMEKTEILSHGFVLMGTGFEPVPAQLVSSQKPCFLQLSYPLPTKFLLYAGY